MEEMLTQAGPSESLKRPKSIAPKPPSLASPTGHNAMPMNPAWLQAGAFPPMSPGGISNSPLAYMMGLTMGLSGNDASGKRPRTFISKEQADVMVDEFEKNPIPNKELRQKLAERLNLSSRVIQVWFQNRRAKLKRKPGSDPLISGPDSPSLTNSEISSPSKKRVIKSIKSEPGAPSFKDPNVGVIRKPLESYHDPNDVRYRSFSMGAIQPRNNTAGRTRQSSLGSNVMLGATDLSLSTGDLTLGAEREMDQALNQELISRTISQPDLLGTGNSSIEQGDSLFSLDGSWNEAAARNSGDYKVGGSMSPPPVAQSQFEVLGMDTFLDGEMPVPRRRVIKNIRADRPRSRSFDSFTDLKMLIDRGRPIPRATLDMDDSQIDMMLRNGGGRLSAVAMEQLPEESDQYSKVGTNPVHNSLQLQALIEETHRISMDVDKLAAAEDLNLNLLNTPTDNLFHY